MKKYVLIAAAACVVAILLLRRQLSSNSAEGQRDHPQEMELLKKTVPSALTTPLVPPPAIAERSPTESLNERSDDTIHNNQEASTAPDYQADLAAVADTFLSEDPDTRALRSLMLRICADAKVDQESIRSEGGKVSGVISVGEGQIMASFEYENGVYGIELACPPSSPLKKSRGWR